MSLGTLWTTPTHELGKRIRAVAAFGGVKLDLPESYTHFEDNKKPEYLSKFPLGKIPALEGADGFRLFESSAIARYVAAQAPNSGLLGSDLKDSALIDQWVSVATAEIGTPALFIAFSLRGALPYNKPSHTFLTDRALRALDVVNKHLETRTYLVTERITLADITLANIIQGFASIIFNAERRTKYNHVVRHTETVINHPKLKEIFGPLEWPEQAAQYVPPAKEKKEAKPAPAPTPKAEKKPAKEEEDDDDDIPKEEPKPKNPLDLLPKSSFNLEDWKRAYSNKETRGPGGAIEWFYQNFDKEGFSVWRADYKYPEDLTQTYMSSNLVGGFFNRLEASRKYLFGSLGVLGEPNNSLISGTLITRGQEILPVVEVAPDYESYNFKRIDLDNAEDKAFFEAALAWDLEIDGKKWVDGKNFK